MEPVLGARRAEYAGARWVWIWLAHEAPDSSVIELVRLDRWDIFLVASLALHASAVMPRDVFLMVPLI